MTLLIRGFLVLVCVAAWGHSQDPAQLSGAQNRSAAAGELRDLKRKLLEQINRDRQGDGLRSVLFSEELARLADLHCREMLAEGYTSHWNRAGLKPYMRYSLGGITDHTAENISGMRSTHFDVSPEQVEREMLERHAGLMDENPPFDRHRLNVLDPAHTHVGIGLAYDETGLRLIEIFANRYVEVEPLPSEAPLSQEFWLKGRMLSQDHELQAITIFYEELPSELTVSDLKGLGSYNFPDRERIMRPKLPETLYVKGQKFHPSYEDGSKGDIEVGQEGSFSCPIVFLENQPGIYTVVVWLKRKNIQSPAIPATNICIWATDRPLLRK